MAYKQVKLLPMSNKVLDGMVKKNNDLYPNKKTNRQELVNELILSEAIKRGVE